MNQMNNTSPGGPVPISVILISLNEEHHIEGVLDNLEGWAQEIFLVDSLSADRTVEIALSRGVHVIQKPFSGFGNQWNFALDQLPISTPWTMKLDPDEQLTPELKQDIHESIQHADSELRGLYLSRRLFFMGKPLPIRQKILRIWRTGTCRFSDVTVNEHPIVEGPTCVVDGDLEHHDSPHLHHWVDKQNQYSTAEARAAYNGHSVSIKPSLIGTALQRRMWIKSHLKYLPLRYFLIYMHCLLVQGAWQAGRVGFIWAHLRSEVYRMRELKLLEMKWLGAAYNASGQHLGEPDPRVPQFDIDGRQISK